MISFISGFDDLVATITLHNDLSPYSDGRSGMNSITAGGVLDVSQGVWPREEGH
jgi:hypothetical protein